MTVSASPFAVFRNRSFARLWAAQLVSTIGDSLVDIAAAILVYRITGSALSVGLMLMATAVPGLVFGLLAGVFVDRYDRKWIMVACDALRAVLVLAIPFLVAFDIAWLYVGVAVVSAVGAFFSPAHTSVLPEIASDEELAAANSFIAISSFGSTAIGFAAGGLIASQFPIAWAFYIDALTFAISAALILGLRVPASTNTERTSVAMVVRNLGAGMQFLFANAFLRSFLVIGGGVAIAFGLWNALLLPFAIRALGASEFVFGLQEALTSVGFVIGSLAMASLADRWREGQWLTVSLIGMGTVGVLYAFATSIPLAIALVMVSGLMNAPYSIAGRLIVQRQTTREVRGRVASTFSVVANVAFLAGMGLAGLADFFDIRMVYLAVSVLTISLGVVASLMPGLGQPAAEWRRAVALLRGAAAAPGLLHTRAAVPGDFDLLAGRIPAMASLTEDQKRHLSARTLVADAPAGTAIVRKGEESTAGYFLLDGCAVAGWDEEGGYRPLETLRAGDFFGEIAALTGARRTANVIAQEDAKLLQVPSDALRTMSAVPELNKLFMSKMTERMLRMDMLELPRHGGISDAVMQGLRDPIASSSAAPTAAVT